MSNKTLDNEIYALLAKSTRLIQANYERMAEFFMNSNNYISYLDEMKIKEIDIGIVSSINLQCTGHGSFAPHKVAARFIENLEQLTENNQEIKRIKIKLSGFDLGRELDIKGGMSKNSRKPTLIEWLTRLLADKMRTLTSLEIRICNVKNCRVDDFKTIMELGLNVQAKELANLSCEFSDWAFAKLQNDKADDVKAIYTKCSKADHDRHYQPNIEDFMSMLEGSFEKTMKQPLLQLKKFRLQISTWYYTDYEVERFFHNAKLAGIENLPKQEKIPQRIQYFHNEFKKRVETLIRELMVELTNMEIDLRNWNHKFQMGMLKSSLHNISSERRNSLSQISRRLTNDQKKVVNSVISKIQMSMMLGKTGNVSKIKEEEQKKQDDKEKEKFFDLAVVV